MIQKIASYFAKMMSDSPEASFGRFASLLCLLFCLGWDTAFIAFVMIHFREFHFVVGDLLAYGGVLMAQIAFCTMFYGVNKLTGMGVFNKNTPGG